MENLRIGVIGTARGGAYAKCARYLPGVEVTAFCGRDLKKTEEAARALGVSNVYADFEELLASDVDAVVVATPIPLHAAQSARALAAGKHVLSEVTAATTIPDLDLLKSAARASDKRYMLAENYCYVRPWTILKNMVSQGLFGEIYYAEADFLMDFQLRPNFPDVQPWRKDVYLGRQGHPYITHSLGPIAQLVGEPIARVSCMGSGKYPDYGIEADNTCVLTLQTQKGKLLRLRHGFVNARPDIYTYCGFQGAKGAYEGARFAGDRHRVYIKGLCAREEWRDLASFSDYLPEIWRLIPEAERDDGWDGGTALMLWDFAQAIRGNIPVPIGIDEAVNWTACGLLSEISAQNGGAPIEIPMY